MNEMLYKQDSVASMSMSGTVILYGVMLAAAAAPASTMAMVDDSPIDRKFDDFPKSYHFASEAPTNFSKKASELDASDNVEAELASLLTDFSEQQVSLDAEAHKILHENLWDLYIGE